jgi:hypothetical protein
VAHGIDRFKLRPALLATSAGIVLALAAIDPASAGATGSYPGETLSLKQTGPAAAGTVSNFEAFGQQTDVESDPGGFDLQVFDKPTSVDPTCGAEYDQENNTWGSDLANEFHPVVGDWQGAGTTFSVPFKISFEKPGPELICAYSTWAYDTAAAAQLTVEVAAGSSPSPAQNPAPTAVSNPGPSSVPADTTKPRVTRSGGKLTCSHGTWTGSPSSYAFGWLLNGHRQNGDHARTLEVSPRLRGHSVQCSVTASNAGGHTSAVSSPYHVH